MCRPAMLLSAVVVLLASNSVSANPASPNQRLKVKYKIKKTNGEVQKQQVMTFGGLLLYVDVLITKL